MSARAIYRRLGVREVWFWDDGEIQVHVLVDGAYQLREKSALVPEIDFLVMLTYLEEPVMSRAMQRYRDALRGLAVPSS